MEKFRSDVQGLRAIAVASVVVYHAFPDLIPGGFAGVDIFFVISGFLISGIVHREIAEGRFSLADFYRKRVRRIFPALFVMLLAVLALGWALLPPNGYKILARNAVAAAVFLSNVDFYRTMGYFAPQAELQPLLHTWSLAVEEQFYLVFPPLLWLLMRRVRGAGLTPVLILALLALLALSQWGIGWSASAAYFLLPFRAFELMMGVVAALAVLPARPLPERLRQGLALAGLALIGASFWGLDKLTPFPGIRAVPATLGCAAMLYLGRGAPTLAGRLISGAPFLWLGAISYSLYLWHWPVFACLRIWSQPFEVPVVAMAGAVAVSVLLGYLSWRFVEEPFRHLPVARVALLRQGAAAMAVCAGLGLAIYLAEGVPQRFSPRVLAMFAAEADSSPARHCAQSNNARMPYARTCVLGAEGARPRLAIWGDSHGGELAKAMADLMAPEGRALRQVTALGCPPVAGVAFSGGNCQGGNDEALAALEADAEIETVLLTANRNQYRARTADAEFEAGFAASVARLRAAGKRVVVLGQIPVMGFDPPLAVGLAAASGQDPGRVGIARAGYEAGAAQWHGFLQDLVARQGIELVLPAGAMCRGDLCPAHVEGEGVLYFDRSHPTMAAARLLAEQILEQLRAPAPRPLPALALGASL
ncbi:MAG: acyltransferase [Defluviimonas sp.]|nr:acyltransferase [Defluviimonas sp.]